MNNQYTFPINSEVPTDDARRLIDEAFEAPILVQQESEPRPYLYHKQLESRIEQMRASATEANLPRGTIMDRVLERFTTTPKSLEDRLIDHESVIVGNILPKHELVAQQRFWYHQGNWYLMQVERDQKEYVSRYQVSETDIYKLVGGREAPFWEGEQERLLDAIDLYHREILRNIYSN